MANNEAQTGNRIVIDPISRIEGHLRIECEIANGKVTDAWSSAQLFRGIEIMLQGRDPRDAYHFTQRACGVCTYVHSLASIRCVDDAVGVDIPDNARLIRNILLGAQYMHDHIVHFYHLHALDWVDVVSSLKADPKKAADIANSISPRKTSAADLQAAQERLKKFVDSGQLGIFTNAYFLEPHPAYKLPAEVNLVATAHYLEALRLQVRAARMMAIFGGKNPHPQSLVVGGVTCYDDLNADRISTFINYWKETRQFINEVYIPDLLAVAGYYKDWGAIGGCTNFLTFGEFPSVEKDIKSRYLPAGVIMNKNLKDIQPFDGSRIEEHVRHSWYEGDQALHPFKGETKPAFTKMDTSDRYSWMKAPRYNGAPMEVGPLARVLVAYASGNKPIVENVNAVLKKLQVGPEALFSTLGRTAARGIETVVIADAMEGWVNQLLGNVKKGNTSLVGKWTMPDKSFGVGYADVPRGALSHWMEIDGKKIKNFQMVVPTTWNLGPRSSDGKRGPLEEALVGTPVADPKRPVEIVRTVHSFDPCIACAVHVIDPRSNEVYKFKVV